jgi:hypothetical protein
MSTHYSNGRSGYAAKTTIALPNLGAGMAADSCDAAQAYRFDAARDSWMMPPTVTR